MAKDPDGRFDSAGQMMKAMRDLLPAVALGSELAGDPNILPPSPLDSADTVVDQPAYRPTGGGWTPSPDSGRRPLPPERSTGQPTSKVNPDQPTAPAGHPVSGPNPRGAVAKQGAPPAERPTELNPAVSRPRVSRRAVETEETAIVRRPPNNALKWVLISIIVVALAIAAYVVWEGL